MSFAFIDNSNITDGKRKFIRSHVMKGKNAGKQRPRIRLYDAKPPPDRDAGGQNGAPTSRNRKPIAKSTEDETSVQTETAISKPIGSEWDYFTFPRKIDQRTRNNILEFLGRIDQTAYRTHFIFPIHRKQQTWFTYLQCNQSFFFCVMAMSEMYRAGHSIPQTTSGLALLYLSTAYRCINNELEAQPLPSDPVLAAVVSLVIFETRNIESSNGGVHLGALKRMIDLRGGFDSLNHPAMMQKLCRADVQYAIYHGTAPRFFRDKFPYATTQKALEDLSISDVALSGENDIPINNPQLRQIHVDLLTACALLNHGHRPSDTEPYIYSEMLLSICYRLLQFWPFTTTSFIDEVEHSYVLGLLAFSITILSLNSSANWDHYEVLAGQLRRATIEPPSTLDMPRSAMLWLVFVAGMSVFSSDDRVHLVPQVKTCLFELGIDSWDNARKAIKNLPWIDLLHDEPGKELWKTVVWS